MNALYATNTGSQTAASTGDDITFDTNQVEEGSDITHSASSADFSLTQNGLYRITYSAVVTNTSSTGNVGLELQEDGTPIDGSVKEAKVSNTSDPATGRRNRSGECHQCAGHHHPQLHRGQYHCDQRGYDDPETQLTIKL